jgi:hypothetical protein
MAGQIQQKPMLDFSKGENTVTSPYLIGPTQAAQLINFILDEHGSLRVRDGTLIQTTSPDAARRIVKIWDLQLVSGTRHRFAILRGTNGQKNTLYDRNTVPWTSKGDFTTTEDVPDAVNFTDRAIFAAGYETPKYSNGGALTALGGAPALPGAKHLVAHLGFLWAWNTAATTTATDGKSSLRASDLNNTDSWPTASQTFIAKDDGQEGRGFGLFTIAETGISPQATAIAFKDFSAYEISGVFGSATFAIQKIKSDMGCVAPRSVQFVSGLGIIRLTHKGFALFDGVNDFLISEEERPRLFGRDDYTGIDWSNVGLSYAAQVQNPPLYICACPTASPGLTRFFIYDLIRKAWTVATFPNPVSTFETILNPAAVPIVMGGGFSDGKIRRYFAGDLDDDGVVIQWTLRTRSLFGQNPLHRAYFRRMMMKLFGVQTGRTVQARFVYGPLGKVIEKFVTKTIRAVTPLIPSPGGDGYGDDPYGDSGYGGVFSATEVVDRDLEFGIGVIANNLFVHVTGSGPGRLRGLDFHLRAKPPTGAATIQ